MNLFITGTDTGVGKTVVTGGLAVALKARGLRVGVMKPVETGCSRQGAHLVPQDALFLKEASGCTAPMDWVNPYALEGPLAPALAAEREGVRIDPDHIAACYWNLTAEHDIVLVEGAGGLLVPIAERYTMLDLAMELQLAVLVVARNVLGVINHTALTVEAAQGRDSTVLGVVLNNTDPESDPATQTNASSLQHWSGTQLLAEIPYTEGLDLDAVAEELNLVVERLCSENGGFAR